MCDRLRWGSSKGSRYRAVLIGLNRFSPNSGMNEFQVFTAFTYLQAAELDMHPRNASNITLVMQLTYRCMEGSAMRHSRNPGLIPMAAALVLLAFAPLSSASDVLYRMETQSSGAELVSSNPDEIVINLELTSVAVEESYTEGFGHEQPPCFPL